MPRSNNNNNNNNNNDRDREYRVERGNRDREESSRPSRKQQQQQQSSSSSSTNKKPSSTRSIKRESNSRNITNKGMNNRNRDSRDRDSQNSDIDDDDEDPDLDLVELEERLTDEVDDEFFQDPRKFHTLHRVIDVLGMQLTLADDSFNSNRGGGNNNSNNKPRRSNSNNGNLQHADVPRIDRNPAYRALTAQQDVVEEAIEHLALIHCADLNGSVVQVGRVARQFHNAATQVQSLRQQVKDIQETLGTGSHQANHRMNGSNGSNGKANNNNNTNDATAAAAAKDAEAARAAASSAMSLRELWLKKLEAEAVLALLEKLDTIRAAPMRFDDLLKAHRIGAAVLTVSGGLDTMFMSDVNQVQALHKIMEQLMIRKQKAEEVVWELLTDVLFLRTGNGTAQLVALGTGAGEVLFGANNNKNDKKVSRTRASISADSSSHKGGSVDSNSILANNSNNPKNNNSNNNTGNASVVGNASVISGVPQRQQSIQSQSQSQSSSTNNNATNPATAASYLWNLPPSGWDYIRRQQSGMVNPFLNIKMRFALDPDDLQLESILRNIEIQQRDRERGRVSDGVDEDLYDDEEEEVGNFLYGGNNSTSSLNVDEKKQDDNNNKGGGDGGSGGELSLSTNVDDNDGRPKAVIPGTMMEAEFDLEADERRSLEEQQYDSQGRRRKQALHMTKPTYLDHVMALRTLVECLVRLRRLDDVERIVTESLEREISQLVQREQARTYLWVENSQLRNKGAGGRYAALLTKAGSGIDLRDFRRHLNHILSAFGNVQIRLIHLTQIIRHRIVST
jgi:hypothetical protein